VFILASLVAQSQKAHVHGAAAVNVALEGPKGELEFESPADNILGFEHAPKTAAQKKTIADVLAKLRTDANTLFNIPNCSLSAKEVDVHREGPQHAEVHAHYTIVCKAAPQGQITLGIFKAYPKLSSVAVTLVTPSQQSSTQATAAKPFISLR
jgi:hypothetical protein